MFKMFSRDSCCKDLKAALNIKTHVKIKGELYMTHSTTSAFCYNVDKEKVGAAVG